jgi:nitrite reductase/ring-hydroxylating ferredoxin subunit
MTKKQFDVAGTADLADGEMRQCSAGETNVLLARIDGTYHAVSATCAHYGAPLAEGVLNGDRIVCPWHHACYNAITGDLLEPPALDALERYDVSVQGGRVMQRFPTNLRQACTLMV